jgi:radical SAM protein (TIGR01212 family)
MKSLFGFKVYKVSVDAGFSCPNRDGKKGVSGCIFCDEKGSSSRTNENLSIKAQVLENIKIRKKRFKAKKFIVYFQSFSNTYAPTETLKKRYDEAINASPDIVGISISTRADCIDEEKIKFISTYKKKLPYVSLEYGMQTSHDKTLKLINRKETFKDFLKAISLTKKYNLHNSAHVILGLPKENKSNMLKTADTLAKLQIEGVKIHLLVVMKNTVLEKMYKNKLYSPLSFEEFINISCDFLERLPKNCIIHRLSTSGHPKGIVAPLWMKKKNLNNEIIAALEKNFSKRKTKQGFFCKYL